MHRVLLVLLIGCGRVGFDPAGTQLQDGGATASVSVTISGQGSVGIAGQFCSASCVLELPIGTPIEPMLVPQDGWSEAGNTFGCPSPCPLDGDLAFEVTFTLEPILANRAFLSSMGVTIPFGGIAGADAICQARATAVGMVGTFIALLSSSTVDARSRLLGSRGWVRLDGLPVLDQPTDLFAGQFYPVDLTEAGTRATGSADLGGTSDSGTSIPSGTCTDWTMNTGNTSGVRTSDYVGASTGTNRTVPCGSPWGLLCFEIGKQVVVAPTPQPVGRYVFISRNTFAGNGGIANADAQCAAEATAASLPGTFRALLATQGATAASRFTSLAGPWRLPNGMLATSDDLSIVGRLLAPISRDATGAPATLRVVWIGAGSLTTAGSAATTCNNWSSITGGSMGQIARSFDTSDGLGVGTSSPCMFPRAIYCAED